MPSLDRMRKIVAAKEPSMLWWEVAFFFVAFRSFSAVFISPSVVYRKPECDLFLLSGEKTPTKDDTRLLLTAKHLNLRLWTNHRCVLSSLFLLLSCFPGGCWWEESTAGFTVCEHWGVPSVGELRLLYLCFQAQGDWASAGRKCHKRVRCTVQNIKLIGRIGRVSVCWLASQSVESRIIHAYILFPLQLEVPGDRMISKLFLFLHLDHSQPSSAACRSVDQSVLAFDWFDSWTRRNRVIKSGSGWKKNTQANLTN